MSSSRGWSRGTFFAKLVSSRYWLKRGLGDLLNLPIRNFQLPRGLGHLAQSPAVSCRKLENTLSLEVASGADFCQWPWPVGAGLRSGRKMSPDTSRQPSARPRSLQMPRTASAGPAAAGFPGLKHGLLEAKAEEGTQSEPTNSAAQRGKRSASSRRAGAFAGLCSRLAPGSTCVRVCVCVCACVG